MPTFDFGDPKIPNYDDSDVEIDDDRSETSEEENDDDDDIRPSKETLYIPDCNTEHKPYVGQLFDTLEEGIKFYKDYAIRCGFTAQKGTKKRRQGDVTFQYVFCFREGHHKRKEVSMNNSGKTRKQRVSGRTGCNARVSLTFVSRTQFVTSAFNEEHNHGFYKIEDLEFIRGNRNVTTAHKQWIIDNYKVDIGLVKAHKLLSQRVGGSRNVGATVIDFLNFERDLKVFIGETDGHYVIESFHKKVSKNTGFYFEYVVDHEDRLSRIFWDDTISRENYKLYGDTIAFDTTYNTNRYGMIFWPFTGIDNHNKSVTLGYGLIGQEDNDSFSWLFRTFLTCMDGKQPGCILTDQDPAIKRSLAEVLDTTTHRLCMWHIMQKLRVKVPPASRKDSTCYKSICSLVWSNIMDIDEFEKKWMAIISEYKLEGNEWLAIMYEIRESWIPAYFKDIPMGLLMRTTSRCESQNSVYGKRKHRRQQLVQFVWWCNTIIDDQRHEHMKQIVESSMCTPKWMGNKPTSLEQHAWELYTRPIFYEIQKDLVRAGRYCRIKDMKLTEMEEVYKICQKNNGEFETTFNLNTEHCTCDCKRFEGCGILCLHIWKVLQNRLAKKIPGSLVNSRWCRENIIGRMTTTNCNTTNATLNQIKHEIWMRVQSITETPNSTESGMKKFLDSFNNYEMETCTESGASSSRTKTTVMEELTGLTMPAELRVKVQNISRTKGIRRMQSIREVIQIKPQKKMRLCHTCNKVIDHDSRTCPER